MKASAFTTFLFSGVLAILATDSQAEVPRVETDFGPVVLDHPRVDKRFSDIIPPERIQRIICLTERGLIYHNRGQPDYHSLVQADYDGLIAHLIASNEKAGFGHGLPNGNEGFGSRLLFVTTDNQIFEVEILTRGGPTRNVSAILIRGSGINARINVNGLKATAADSRVPSVEIDFGSMEAPEWRGKRLSEIVSRDSIKRIVLTQQTTWLFDRFRWRINLPETQPLYDALVAHFFSSTEKAANGSLAANERTLAELMLLTTNGEMFRLEILGGSAIGKSAEKPIAILLHGGNKGARINVKDFKFKNPKQ